jgi:hypothetical protein
MIFWEKGNGKNDKNWEWMESSQMKDKIHWERCESFHGWLEKWSEGERKMLMSTVRWKEWKKVESGKAHAVVTDVSFGWWSEAVGFVFFRTWSHQLNSLSEDPGIVERVRQELKVSNRLSEREWGIEEVLPLPLPLRNCDMASNPSIDHFLCSVSKLASIDGRRRPIIDWNGRDCTEISSKAELFCRHAKETKHLHLLASMTPLDSTSLDCD